MEVDHTKPLVDEQEYTGMYLCIFLVCFFVPSEESFTADDNFCVLSTNKRPVLRRPAVSARRILKKLIILIRELNENDAK